MGPKAGIAELILPEVEPGSSIMPGKVNPSVAEAIHMVACQVVGNDAAIQMGLPAGQLQLNVMTPMILFNLEFSASLIKKTADMMRIHCIDEIILQKDVIKKLLDNSLVFATALVPYLGYQVVAELVNEGLKDSMPIAEVALKYELMSVSELDFVLNPANVAAPSLIDVALRDSLQARKSYVDYRELIGK
jgi:aspartate ammonia-lyase